MKQHVINQPTDSPKKSNSTNVNKSNFTSIVHEPSTAYVAFHDITEDESSESLHMLDKKQKNKNVCCCTLS